MKHTKIVATIGPASESKERLREMVKAGMNVVRLNFSHGEYEWHESIINRVRELSEELQMPIAILADIQGPRIRTRVAEPFRVSTGEHVFASDSAHEGEVPDLHGHLFFLDQPEIVRDIEVDHGVLVEDGTLQFRVMKKEGALLELEAMNDGEVKNRKGVNLPDSKLSLPVITEKDRRDIRFVLDQRVDYVGMSFVGSADDVRSMRALFAEAEIPEELFPRVVVKIERKEAVKNLKEIIREADAVMVARGDLGIELPETKVAILQKEIIAESLSAVRPVIVATQMMKSMTENPRPTRAEVSDVTNAVIDHADAVMLSEESAMGKYPVETIRTMAEIIAHTEESPFDNVYNTMGMNLRSEYSVMVRSVYELAKSYEADIILLMSESGFTARLMSHFRPSSRLFVATNNRRAWNRMALMWGVDAFLFEEDADLDQIIDRLTERLLEEGKVRKGERAVLCLGRHRKSDQLQLVGVREITS
ncbi:MAG: pyruvate kinase [Candidatus Moraniibacteriota bacterium]|nr:MAG: pyruvate kinase [Candidatus Moranbacteria bacterium]